MIDRHTAPRYQVLRPLVFAAALATLAGCGFPVNQRGNLPKPDLLAQIRPGVTDKNSVKALIGTLSSIAAFDGDTWYYISKEEKQIAFLKPVVENQQVYVIHFNDKGVVSDVSHRGLDDAQSMTMNPDATPAPGREFTFLEQLIGNFGKFNAGGSGNGSTPGGPNTGGP
jgi:outer membrane protein assembly factor BamE (lipoprotein component of BamABCDE complex)